MTRPPCHTPEPRSDRYVTIDLWRGVACLLVVVFHASLFVPRWPGHWTEPFFDAMYGPKAIEMGYLGVLLFFVISGYCITTTSDRHRFKTGGAMRFMKRRLRRIYPPYWLTLLLTFGLFAGSAWGGWPLFTEGIRPLSDPDRLNLLQWIGNITLTEQWLSPALGMTQGWFVEVAWTLCYEEQFYLICFAILLLAPRRLFAALWIITISFVGAWVIARANGKLVPLQGTVISPEWWQFCCGIGLYYVLNRMPGRDGQQRGRWVMGTALAVGVPIMLSFSAWTGSTHPAANPYFPLAICITFAGLLYVLRPYDTKLSRVRVLGGLFFLGRISYSLYLIHVPICKLTASICFQLGCWTPTRALLISVPASIAASIVAAYLFYQAVEKHFLNTAPAAAKDRPRRSATPATEPRKPYPQAMPGLPA